MLQKTNKQTNKDLLPSVNKLVESKQTQTSSRRPGQALGKGVKKQPHTCIELFETVGSVQMNESVTYGFIVDGKLIKSPPSHMSIHQNSSLTEADD